MEKEKEKGEGSSGTVSLSQNWQQAGMAPPQELHLLQPAWLT